MDLRNMTEDEIRRLGVPQWRLVPRTKVLYLVAALLGVGLALLARKPDAVAAARDFLRAWSA
jgi:hypothetical protein